MKPDNGEDGSKDSLSKSLWLSLRQKAVVYAAAFVFGFVPALIFIRRVYLSYSSRLVKVFLAIVALGYFPLVALCSSLAFGLCFFCLRQTTVVERILNKVCDSIVELLHKKLPSSAQDAEMSVDELNTRVQEVIDAARNNNARSKSPLRSFAGFVLGLAFFLLRKAAKQKFEKAMITKSEGAPPIISIKSAATSLQGEVVNAVLSPFKNTVRMYFAASLILSLALFVVPLKSVG
ncbi:unnamed protein product [Chondrus crispus]|uniref:Uncharacterized protein n=1 Tax=Chondrus crispus TaxID=2769 RepID=R7Q5X9_CHOCR|nr:unnamed protein product [Chondrus crispus]CDF33248.1 unnamed protein product [Chondrus crispus]|eukprot:XP_005713051.1 unnamed protein product [Chondrus crispus]